MASGYACVRTERFLQSKSLLNFKGKHEPEGPSRKWFVVQTSTSVALALDGTSGRPFKLSSTGQNVVVTISWVIFLFPINKWKTFLKLLISPSRTPPWCDSFGGVNFHLIQFASRVSVKTFWFQWSCCSTFRFHCNKVHSIVRPYDRRNASPGDKLFTAHHTTAHHKPFTAHQLVTLDGTSSKWTARVVKQVKRNPQRLTVGRLTDR